MSPPHDTSSYHVDPACPLIPSQDGASLLTLTPEALSEAPYQTLLPCTLCFGQLEGNALEEMSNPFVYRPRSAYDTAKNSTLITQAGAYLAGRDMDPGIYTIESDARCAGEARVLTCDGEALYAYPLEGGTLCSLYLGEGMTVELPANCQMRRVRYNPVFEDQQQKLTISHRRFFTWMELPTYDYLVTSIPGEEAYFIVSTIGAETGKEAPVRTEIREGETVSLELWRQDDGLSSSSTASYGPPKSAWVKGGNKHETDWGPFYAADDAVYLFLSHSGRRDGKPLQRPE